MPKMTGNSDPLFLEGDSHLKEDLIRVFQSSKKGPTLTGEEECAKCKLQIAYKAVIYLWQKADTVTVSEVFNVSCL